ncbi:unnamed protein product [Moneuplotes crassus]|uniref:Uncharacterized protein n=1 Tax=Euplotes crassus TaxID=5936 RepID=A0AAD1XBB2_EUPCR|nr:unnamed protein product [Moneuplotes crassus]
MFDIPHSDKKERTDFLEKFLSLSREKKALQIHQHQVSLRKDSRQQIFKNKRQNLTQDDEMSKQIEPDEKTREVYEEAIFRTLQNWEVGPDDWEIILEFANNRLAIEHTDEGRLNGVFQILADNVSRNSPYDLLLKVIQFWRNLCQSKSNEGLEFVFKNSLHAEIFKIVLQDEDQIETFKQGTMMLYFCSHHEEFFSFVKEQDSLLGTPENLQEGSHMILDNALLNTKVIKKDEFLNFIISLTSKNISLSLKFMHIFCDKHIKNEKELQETICTFLLKLKIEDYLEKNKKLLIWVLQSFVDKAEDYELLQKVALSDTLKILVIEYIVQEETQQLCLKLCGALIPYNYLLIRKVLISFGETKTISKHSISSFLEYIKNLTEYLYMSKFKSSYGPRLSGLLCDPGYNILHFALKQTSSESIISILHICFNILEEGNPNVVFELLRANFLGLMEDIILSKNSLVEETSLCLDCLLSFFKIFHKNEEKMKYLNSKRYQEAKNFEDEMFYHKGSLGLMEYSKKVEILKINISSTLETLLHSDGIGISEKAYELHVKYFEEDNEPSLIDLAMVDQ